MFLKKLLLVGSIVAALFVSPSGVRAQKGVPVPETYEQFEADAKRIAGRIDVLMGEVEKLQGGTGRCREVVKVFAELGLDIAR